MELQEESIASRITDSELNRLQFQEPKQQLLALSGFLRDNSKHNVIQPELNDKEHVVLLKKIDSLDINDESSLTELSIFCEFEKASSLKELSIEFAIHQKLLQIWSFHAVGFIQRREESVHIMRTLLNTIRNVISKGGANIATSHSFVDLLVGSDNSPSIFDVLINCDDWELCYKMIQILQEMRLDDHLKTQFRASLLPLPFEKQIHSGFYQFMNLLNSSLPANNLQLKNKASTLSDYKHDQISLFRKHNSCCYQISNLTPQQLGLQPDEFCISFDTTQKAAEAFNTKKSISIWTHFLEKLGQEVYLKSCIEQNQVQIFEVFMEYKFALTCRNDFAQAGYFQLFLRRSVTFAGTGKLSTFVSIVNLYIKNDMKYAIKGKQLTQQVTLQFIRNILSFMQEKSWCGQQKQISSDELQELQNCKAYRLIWDIVINEQLTYMYSLNELVKTEPEHFGKIDDFIFNYHLLTDQNPLLNINLNYLAFPNGPAASTQPNFYFQYFHSFRSNYEKILSTKEILLPERLKNYYDIILEQITQSVKNILDYPKYLDGRLGILPFAFYFDSNSTYPQNIKTIVSETLSKAYDLVLIRSLEPNNPSQYSIQCINWILKLTSIISDEQKKEIILNKGVAFYDKLFQIILGQNGKIAAYIFAILLENFNFGNSLIEMLLQSDCERVKQEIILQVCEAIFSQYNYTFDLFMTLGKCDAFSLNSMADLETNQKFFQLYIKYYVNLYLHKGVNMLHNQFFCKVGMKFFIREELLRQQVLENLLQKLESDLKEEVSCFLEINPLDRNLRINYSFRMNVKYCFLMNSLKNYFDTMLLLTTPSQNLEDISNSKESILKHAVLVLKLILTLSNIFTYSVNVSNASLFGMRQILNRYVELMVTNSSKDIDFSPLFCSLFSGIRTDSLDNLDLQKYVISENKIMNLFENFPSIARFYLNYSTSIAQIKSSDEVNLFQEARQSEIMLYILKKIIKYLSDSNKKDTIVKYFQSHHVHNICKCFDMASRVIRRYIVEFLQLKVSDVLISHQFTREDGTFEQKRLKSKRLICCITEQSNVRRIFKSMSCFLLSGHLGFQLNINGTLAIEMQAYFFFRQAISTSYSNIFFSEDLETKQIQNCIYSPNVTPSEQQVIYELVGMKFIPVIFRMVLIHSQKSKESALKKEIFFKNNFFLRIFNHLFRSSVEYLKYLSARTSLYMISKYPNQYEELELAPLKKKMNNYLPSLFSYLHSQFSAIIVTFQEKQNSDLGKKQITSETQPLLQENTSENGNKIESEALDDSIEGYLSTEAEEENHYEISQEEKRWRKEDGIEEKNEEFNHIEQPCQENVQQQVIPQISIEVDGGDSSEEEEIYGQSPTEGKQSQQTQFPVSNENNNNNQETKPTLLDNHHQRNQEITEQANLIAYENMKQIQKKNFECQFQILSYLIAFAIRNLGYFKQTSLDISDTSFSLFQLGSLLPKHQAGQFFIPVFTALCQIDSGESIRFKSVLNSFCRTETFKNPNSSNAQSNFDNSNLVFISEGVNLETVKSKITFLDVTLLSSCEISNIVLERSQIILACIKNTLLPTMLLAPQQQDLVALAEILSVISKQVDSYFKISKENKKEQMFEIMGNTINLFQECLNLAEKTHLEEQSILKIHDSHKKIAKRFLLMSLEMIIKERQLSIQLFVKHKILSILSNIKGNSMDSYRNEMLEILYHIFFEIMNSLELFQNTVEFTVKHCLLSEARQDYKSFSFQDKYKSALDLSLLKSEAKGLYLRGPRDFMEALEKIIVIEKQKKQKLQCFLREKCKYSWRFPAYFDELQQEAIAQLFGICQEANLENQAYQGMKEYQRVKFTANPSASSSEIPVNCLNQVSFGKIFLSLLQHYPGISALGELNLQYQDVLIEFMAIDSMGATKNFTQLYLTLLALHKNSTDFLDPYWEKYLIEASKTVSQWRCSTFGIQSFMQQLKMLEILRDSSFFLKHQKGQQYMKKFISEIFANSWMNNSSPNTANQSSNSLKNTFYFDNVFNVPAIFQDFYREYIKNYLLAKGLEDSSLVFFYKYLKELKYCLQRTSSRSETNQQLIQRVLEGQVSDQHPNYVIDNEDTVISQNNLDGISELQSHEKLHTKQNSSEQLPSAMELQAFQSVNYEQEDTGKEQEFLEEFPFTEEDQIGVQAKQGILQEQSTTNEHLIFQNTDSNSNINRNMYQIEEDSEENKQAEKILGKQNDLEESIFKNLNSLATGAKVDLAPFGLKFQLLQGIQFTGGIENELLSGVKMLANLGKETPLLMEDLTQLLKTYCYYNTLWKSGYNIFVLGVQPNILPTNSFSKLSPENAKFSIIKEVNNLALSLVAKREKLIKQGIIIVQSVLKVNNGSQQISSGLQRNENNNNFQNKKHSKKENKLNTLREANSEDSEIEQTELQELSKTARNQKNSDASNQFEDNEFTQDSLENEGGFKEDERNIRESIIRTSYPGPTEEELDEELSKRTEQVNNLFKSIPDSDQNKWKLILVIRRYFNFDVQKVIDEITKEIENGDRHFVKILSERINSLHDDIFLQQHNSSASTGFIQSNKAIKTFLEAFQPSFPKEKFHETFLFSDEFDEYAQSTAQDKDITVLFSNRNEFMKKTQRKQKFSQELAGVIKTNLFIQEKGFLNQPGKYQQQEESGLEEDNMSSICKDLKVTVGLDPEEPKKQLEVETLNAIFSDEFERDCLIEFPPQCKNILFLIYFQKQFLRIANLRWLNVIFDFSFFFGQVVDAGLMMLEQLSNKKDFTLTQTNNQNSLSFILALLHHPKNRQIFMQKLRSKMNLVFKKEDNKTTSYEGFCFSDYQEFHYSLDELKWMLANKYLILVNFLFNNSEGLFELFLDYKERGEEGDSRTLIQEFILNLSQTENMKNSIQKQKNLLANYSEFIAFQAQSFEQKLNKFQQNIYPFLSAEVKQNSLKSLHSFMLNGQFISCRCHTLLNKFTNLEFKKLNFLIEKILIRIDSTAVFSLIEQLAQLISSDLETILDVIFNTMNDILSDFGEKPLHTIDQQERENYYQFLWTIQSKRPLETIYPKCEKVFFLVKYARKIFQLLLSHHALQAKRQTSQQMNEDNQKNYQNKNSSFDLKSPWVKSYINLLNISNQKLIQDLLSTLKKAGLFRVFTKLLLFSKHYCNIILENTSFTEKYNKYFHILSQLRYGYKAIFYINYFLNQNHPSQVEGILSQQEDEEKISEYGVDQEDEHVIPQKKKIKPQESTKKVKPTSFYDQLFELNEDVVSLKNEIISKEKIVQLHEEALDFDLEQIESVTFDSLVEYLIRLEKVVFYCIFKEPQEFVKIIQDPILPVMERYSLQLKTMIVISQTKFRITSHSYSSFSNGLTIVSERTDIIGNSIPFLLGLKSRDLCMETLYVKWKNESGIDEGGPRREWFTLMFKQLLDPRFGLFKETGPHKRLFPNEFSFAISNDLLFFKSLGILLGKAFLECFLVQIQFAKPFLRLILGRPVGLSDLEDIDPELYKNLLWLLNNEISPEVLSINFTYEKHFGGKKYTVELKENGKNINVDETNKREYVQSLCKQILIYNISHQVQALISGFEEIICKDYLSLLDEHMLSSILSGSPEISSIATYSNLFLTSRIEELKDTIKLIGYTKNDKQIKWLFEILESYTEHEKTLFIFFITGSMSVPHGGFKHFPITVSSTTKIDRLPVAHTCSNILDLPTYQSYERLEDVLRKSIYECQGFELA